MARRRSAGLGRDGRGIAMSDSGQEPEVTETTDTGRVRASGTLPPSRARAPWRTLGRRRHAARGARPRWAEAARRWIATRFHTAMTTMTTTLALRHTMRTARILRPLVIGVLALNLIHLHGALRLHSVLPGVTAPPSLAFPTVTIDPASALVTGLVIGLLCLLPRWLLGTRAQALAARPAVRAPLAGAQGGAQSGASTPSSFQGSGGWGPSTPPSPGMGSVPPAAPPQGRSPQGAPPISPIGESGAGIDPETGYPAVPVPWWRETPLSPRSLERLRALESDLSARIVGQEEAIREVARTIHTAALGMNDETKPIATFLFPGPTGVGKTELVRVLAEILNGDPESMVRLDMSEFTDAKHDAWKLYGAQESFQASSAEGGQLTRAVLHNKYSLILLDEIEKADIAIYDKFLQVWSAARMTTGQGVVVPFKHSLFFLTTNIAQAAINAHRDEPDAIKAIVKREVMTYLKPEIVNRLDKIVPFRHLSKDEIDLITRREFARVAARIVAAPNSQVVLEATDVAIDALAVRGYDPDMGARPVKRALQDNVSDALASAIIHGQVQRGDRVSLDYRDGAFHFDVVEQAPDAPPAQGRVRGRGGRRH